MARDVDRSLAYIIGKEGGMDIAGAKAYLARLAREGRYARDVYRPRSRGAAACAP
jgi:sulfite reductase alpha subunit-like flavoprotein